MVLAGVTFLLACVVRLMMKKRPSSGQVHVAKVASSADVEADRSAEPGRSEDAAPNSLSGTTKKIAWSGDQTAPKTAQSAEGVPNTLGDQKAQKKQKTAAKDEEPDADLQHLRVTTPFIDVRRRCIHSRMILGALMYLALTTLQLRVLKCTECRIRLMIRPGWRATCRSSRINIAMQTARRAAGRARTPVLSPSRSSYF
jgi:hypothetical protein